MMLRPSCRRSFHASASTCRPFFAVLISPKEAAQPIPFPSSVRIAVHRIPVEALPQECPHGRFSYQEMLEHKDRLFKFRETSVYYKQLKQETAVVEVRGPLGVAHVPIPEWIDLAVGDRSQSPVDIWHGQGATGGQNDNDVQTDFSSDLMPAQDEQHERLLHVACLHPEAPMQQRHWGFYKRRIARYVQGVSEGFTIPIQFVGVGYRAQIEPLRIEGPLKHDALMFESWLNRWRHLIMTHPYRKFLAERFPDSLWGQMIQLRQHLQLDTNLFFRTPEPRLPEIPLLPLPSKIVMKVGFSHNVEILVPPFIRAQAPSNTSLVLDGIHIDKVRELATAIRKHRPPEPYKGKGIFVAGETIKLKQKKLK